MLAAAAARVCEQPAQRDRQVTARLASSHRANGDQPADDMLLADAASGRMRKRVIA
jgi:hypothetical protein